MRIRVGALFLCAILLGLLAWLQFDSRTARRSGREPGAPARWRIPAQPTVVDQQAAADPGVVSSAYSGAVVDHAGRPVEAADGARRTIPGAELRNSIATGWRKSGVLQWFRSVRAASMPHALGIRWTLSTPSRGETRRNRADASRATTASEP